MTDITRIDDYRIPSNEEVVLAGGETQPERVGADLKDGLSAAALAEALRHAAPMSGVDQSAVDRNRLEFGGAALQSAAMPDTDTVEPTVEVLPVPTDPTTLYGYSYHVAELRRGALDQSLDMAA